MKKALLYFVLACIFYTGNAFSQSISLGLEGGVNIANVSITPDQTSNARTGVIVGGIVDINLSPTIAISPALRFNMKGFKTTVNGVTFTDKLNYIEIPALLKVKFPLTEVKPYLIGGPVVGFQISANEEQSNGTNSQTVDASSAYESIDFGLLFGGGIDFKVGAKTILFIQPAYYLGLSNIWKQSTTVTVKNNGFQITGGVKFNL